MTFLIVFKINFADIFSSYVCLPLNSNEVDKYETQCIPMFQLETH